MDLLCKLKSTHTDIMVKKRFYVQKSVKKDMLIVLWDMKRPINKDFHEKGPTVNNASSGLCLRQNYLYLLNIMYVCVLEKNC